MVEIKRTDSTSSSKPEDEDKYRLVYSKSKVYVNPTAYARDNIPGFVALVKRVNFRKYLDYTVSTFTHSSKEVANPIYLLAWIPESLLNERGTAEWDKFVKIEENSASEDDEGARHTTVCSNLLGYSPTSFVDVVLIDLPFQRPESYAFSVPLTSIYSLIVHAPTLSSWCPSNFPVLYLH
jgi:hypothetical protein